MSSYRGTPPSSAGGGRAGYGGDSGGGRGGYPSSGTHPSSAGPPGPSGGYGSRGPPVGGAGGYGQSDARGGPASYSDQRGGGSAGYGDSRGSGGGYGGDSRGGAGAGGYGDRGGGGGYGAQRSSGGGGGYGHADSRGGSNYPEPRSGGADHAPPPRGGSSGGGSYPSSSGSYSRGGSGPAPPPTAPSRPGPSTAPSSSYGQRGPPPGGPPSMPLPPGPPPSSTPSSSASSQGGAMLRVTGCANDTVSKIIKGDFLTHESNHGKPVYTKQGGNVNVLIYYWDERDGPSFSGWWFGPKVGGDQVWAYNKANTSMPPTAGWHVPWDGPPDPLLQILQVPGGSAGSGRDRSSRDAGAAYDDRRGRRDEGRRGHEDDRPRRGGEDSRRAEEDRRRADERRRQEEEQRRRAEEQRRAEDEHRREMDRRRREEEKRRYEEEQRRKEAEEKRRREEAERQRREEEKKRREQGAEAAVHKIIQKLRGVTPENFDALRAELDDVQKQNFDALGSLRDRSRADAEKAIRDAHARVQQITERRVQEQLARDEAERKRKEDEERVAGLMAGCKKDVEAAESKSKEVVQDVTDKMPSKDTEPDGVVQLCKELIEKLKAAREEVGTSSKAFQEKKHTMGSSEAARNVRRDMDSMEDKMYHAGKALDKLWWNLEDVRDKAERKKIALAKLSKKEAEFQAINGHNHDKLSREDVAKFASDKFSYELPQDKLDAVMAALEPITLKKFARLRGMVAIARSEELARKKRAEEEEKRRVEAEQRKAMQKTSDECLALVTTAEASAARADDAARVIAKEGQSYTAEKLTEAADGIDAIVKDAQVEVQKAHGSVVALEEEYIEFEKLQAALKRDVQNLQQRCNKVEERLERAKKSADEARASATQKAFAQLEQRKVEAVTVIRTSMTSAGKTVDALFGEVAGAEAATAVSSEKFSSFLSSLEGFKVADDTEAQRLFKHLLPTGAEELSKEAFADLLKLYYKCVRSTVMGEDVPIKSKPVRKVELNEVLEALEAPAKDEGAKVMRVKCKAASDGSIGFVTIAGNQGTTFLQEGGNIFDCLKEAELSESLASKDSKAIRRIEKGELIEILEFNLKDESVDPAVTRVKGRAKLDGAVGYVTLSSTGGTAVLQPK
eukprot:TRINITY_DN4666_c0_g1_i1.p1 TRINITY_DN4666_c0_g1~~TRINITY_DN4666_c0_g1_i1.p1  ORF type:complete len:1128 (+),score=369.85 TRINITY_DN4666_c0_g1_i1:84-3467(+)